MTEAGKRFLTGRTPRERDVIATICSGGSYIEMAESLGIAVNTAKKYTSLFLESSGMESRILFVLWCFRNGVVACPCGQNERELTPRAGG